MALTQGAWTIQTVSGHSVFTCTVTATTSENDLYTLKTPKELDTTRPWTLFVNTAAVALDGSTLPLDIYGGYADNFEITGDAGTIAATSGGIIYQDAIDDVKSVQLNFSVVPGALAARVKGTLAGVSGYGDVGTLPYYAFSLDGASPLNAATCTFAISQYARYLS